MEEKSDLVAIGKLIDEHSYKREEKHIDIDGTINIDFIGDTGTVHEVKKSGKMEKADIYQVKYYLYYLKKRGVENIDGVVNYPKQREKVKVSLSESDMAEMETLLAEIREIIGRSIPTAVRKTKVCKKCSYFELCYI